MLKYSKANAKIEQLAAVSEIAQYLQNKRKVYSLDLLSGWSCPFAVDCLSKVHMIDGKRVVKDGPHTKFRCFSASQEALFPHVYNSRKHNFDLLKAAKGIDAKAALIQEAMPKNLGVCRIHVGGDFFNQEYFDAWVKVAENNFDRLFYAYTKSLPFWLAYDYLSDNFVVTASRGGRHDGLIDQHGLREAIVIFEEKVAKLRGLEIDHDDSHAADPSKRDQSFALLLHGVQPKGSEASKALSKLKGKGSYSRKSK